jgi:ABC-type glycerol-3-phosphate transport system permease component
MHRRGFKSPLHAAGFYLVVAIFIVITLFPLVWVLRLSLAGSELLAEKPGSILPKSGEIIFDDPKDDKDNPWLTASYETIFNDTNFKKGLTNSVIIAGLTTFVCLTIGSVAAYALARVNFLARKPVLSLVLAISFFPAVAIIAPLFLQFTSLGIINTYWAVIIPDVLIALPLTVYLLVAYFRELPLSLEEAAKVDGATTWQAFWRITIPLSMPGVVTTGLLTFIFAWNEFLFANTFTLDPTVQPATVLIPQFATIYTTDYGAQAAAAIVLTLPLVILVLFFQKKIVSGLTAGATTG